MQEAISYEDDCAGVMATPVFPKNMQKNRQGMWGSYIVQNAMGLGKVAKRQVRPERNLIASVLAFAFLDLQPNRKPIVRASAHRWLMGMETPDNGDFADYPFRMAKICEHLEFSVEAVREIATRMYHNPSHFEW